MQTWIDCKFDPMRCLHLISTLPGVCICTRKKYMMQQNSMEVEDKEEEEEEEEEEEDHDEHRRCSKDF